MSVWVEALIFLATIVIVFPAAFIWMWIRDNRKDHP